jgi:hypothetical protein
VIEAAAQPAWTFRFTPYGWLTAWNGTQTVRGRSVKVDASFIDIVENSDTLVALMGDFEARVGRIALLGDVVWSKVGAERSSVRSRTLAPGVTGSLATSLGLDVEMAIAEVGIAYEVARSGPLAFDNLGGARYWYQEADLSLAVDAADDIGDLPVAGARAFARSGSVDWLDPIVGHGCATPWHQGMSCSCVATSAASASEATSPAGYRCLRLRTRHLPRHHLFRRDRLPGAVRRLCPRRGPAALRVRHDPTRADPRREHAVLTREAQECRSFKRPETIGYRCRLSASA